MAKPQNAPNQTFKKIRVTLEVYFHKTQQSSRCCVTNLEACLHRNVFAARIRGLRDLLLGSNGLEPQSWVNGNGTSYIYFGSGEFDGQGLGHDFSGTLYMPPSGSINSCDGGRSHTYCDYRQQLIYQWHPLSAVNTAPTTCTKNICAKRRVWAVMRLGAHRTASTAAPKNKTKQNKPKTGVLLVAAECGSIPQDLCSAVSIIRHATL